MDKKGSILMISLWILAILAVFAIGLGHRASINLRLARYQRDRLKAYCLAEAAIYRAIVELEKDKNASGYDSLNETWSSGVDPVTKEPLFKNIEIDKGSDETFTVRYLYDRDNYLCMADEERKININTASAGLLFNLLKDSNFQEAQAQEFLNYIRVWRGDKDATLNAKAETYKNFKRSPFSNCEEVILILDFFYKNRGEADCRTKAQETFNGLKDLITVYADNLNTFVNINTTSERILTILANSVAEDDEQRNCVARVVSKIIELREQEEKKCFENLDSIKIDVAAGSPDENLLANLKKGFILKSGYFKIEATGNAGKTIKKITAIYNRQDKKIVYWHEN